MAIGHKTVPYIRRSFGTIHHKNLLDVSFGYTETRKKVAGAATDTVVSGASLAAAGGTISTGITNPDVPRVISITPTGTTADIAAGVVEVHGTNVEGKTISEEFTLTANQSTTVTGTKAFKEVTSIDYPPQDGASATLDVGYGDALGVNHRLYQNQTTVKVYTSTSVASRIPPTLQGAPTIVANESEIEKNTVTPATAPDGTTFLTICYIFDYWATSPTNDNPAYLESTTTSTSTTTATTTSTSTSSTSTSTSSTSTSTSSTSTSTSSTSTSTTTTP